MIRLARIGLALLLVLGSLRMVGYGEEATINAEEAAKKMEESFKSEYLKMMSPDAPLYCSSFYILFADSLTKRGEYEAAGVVLEKVRRYFPMDYHAQYGYCASLGRLAKHTNEYAKAIEAWQDLMKTYEKDFSSSVDDTQTVSFRSHTGALYSIADLYEDWNKYAQALEYWDKLIDFLNQPESEFDLGYRVKKRDLRDYEVNVRYPARKATVCFKMGKFAEAIKLGEKIRQWASQTDVPPEMNLERKHYIKYFIEVLVTKQLADSYLESGNVDEAMKYYLEIAERKDPARRYGRRFGSEYKELVKGEIQPLIEKYKNRLSSSPK